MAKFSKKTRLSLREARELMLEFFESVGTVRGSQEIATLFQDLLTEQELIMIAKRLKIAKLLLEGLTFERVVREMKTSMATVARVNAWLAAAGEGFRMVHERSKTRKGSTSTGGWRITRRRYPMYRWPQLLLEEISRNASRRQRERLLRVIETIAEKSRVHGNVLKALRS